VFFGYVPDLYGPPALNVHQWAPFADDAPPAEGELDGLNTTDVLAGCGNDVDAKRIRPSYLELVVSAVEPRCHRGMQPPHQSARQMNRTIHNRYANLVLV